MKCDALIWIARNFLADLRRDPKALYRVASWYPNMRSLSFPAGSLPLADIFDFIPKAMEQPVVFQGVFERPIFPRHLPQETEHYTASTSLADSYCLALLAQTYGSQQILEVGTSFGQTALLFALNTPAHSQITTLDIQRDNPTVGVHFQKHPLHHKIVQKFSTLPALEKSLTPHSFDLIFIDGDHSYQGVLQDTECALRLIRSGGLICWHDYVFKYRRSVVKALDQLRQQNGLNIKKIAYTNVSAAII
jgi:predicted O-methyltransferase YrrM